MKNADEAELRQVASEPLDLNVYNVNDFPLLSKLVSRLVHILCGRIEERGISKRNSSHLRPLTSHTWPEIDLSLSLSTSAGTRPRPTADPTLSRPTPTNLRFSELGSREVKLHWTNPARPVQQYRVVYHSAEDNKAKEVRNTHKHAPLWG